MAAAGPFTSFLIALVLGFGWFLGDLGHAPIAVVVILQYGALINAILGVFNLLPAFPLDGGRVLRGVIWKRSKSFLRATKTATRVSEALSLLMIAAGLVLAVFGEFLNGIWLVFLGWFIRSGAETGLRQTIMEETLSGMKVETVMTREVLTVPPNITVQQLISDYFLVHPHGGYPVVSEDEILGVVTLQCARSVPKDKREATTVKEAMIPCERSVMINRSMSALDAMNMMARENVGRVIVVEGNKLVGIVTRGDLIRAIQTRQELG
jgi:CBS domain-containing protein